MAERGDVSGDGVSSSVNNCDDPGVTVPPVSPENDSSTHYAQDLKSVLVTSVLNLEKLDVDLYR